MSFKSLVRELYKVKAIRKGKLSCADCGRHLHKRDRYRIIAVQHLDCGDVRLVGQKSIPMPGVSDGNR